MTSPPPWSGGGKPSGTRQAVARTEASERYAANRWMTGASPDSRSSLPRSFRRSKYGWRSGGPRRLWSRAVIRRCTPWNSGARSRTRRTLAAAPRAGESSRESVSLMVTLRAAPGQRADLRLGPHPGLAGGELHGLQPVGAGEARVDRAQRDGHVRQPLAADHRRDGLQVLVGRRADAPAPRAVVLAGDHEVVALAARG